MFQLINRPVSKFRVASGLPWFGVLVFGSLGLISVHGQLPVERSTSVYLEELEQRQLFSSAIRHCELRFAEPNLPPGEKSRLAAHWIRCLTLRTLSLEPPAAAEVWPQVRTTSKRLVAETQLFPQHALVRFQACLIGLAEARLASLFPASATDRAQLREQGIESARLSLNELRLLHEELLRQAPGLPQRSPTTELYPELNRDQMYALARDVEYQMLAALNIRARFYTESEQASRRDTYQQIIERATELQPKVSNESVLWWETQYLSLEAWRGLEDWDQWTIKWQNSPLPLAPEQVLGKLTAARLEALLDQDSIKNPRNYRESISQANDFFVLLQKRDASSLREVKNAADLSQVTAWPEFDLARARLYLLLATEADRVATQKSGQQTDEARLGAESQILEFSRAVGKQHGSFWSGELHRRLLTGTGIGSLASSASVSPLLIRQMITEGDWSQVRDLVQTGVRQAVATKNSGLAIQLAELVAGIPKLVPPQPWMVEQIEAATLEFPQLGEAATTHHYANIIAYQLTQLQPEYHARAREVWQRHVATWPESETAHSIRLQIAAVEAKNDQFASAATLLMAIPPTSPSYPKAMRQFVGAIGGLILDPLVEPGQRSQAAEQWVKLIRPKLQVDGQWPAQWTPDTKRLALVLVQLQLEAQDRQAAWIASLLRIIDEQPPEMDANLRSRFAAVAALAEFEQVSGGTQSLESLSQLGPQMALADLLWLTQALELRLPKLGLAGERELAQAGANRSGMVRRAALLQLTVLGIVEKHHPQATEGYEDWLKLQHLTSLLFSDRIADAIEIAKVVAGKNEKSLAHQQWLGYSLTRSNHPEDSAAAEKQWRKIGFLTQKNSDPWFEAKYYLAESQRRLGKKEEAVRVLQFVKETESQAWQQSPYREPLERLLKSIGSNP